MPKYQLSKNQVDVLFYIINESSIQGKAAETIVGLKQALGTPLPETPPKPHKPPVKKEEK